MDKFNYFRERISDYKIVLNNMINLSIKNYFVSYFSGTTIANFTFKSITARIPWNGLFVKLSRAEFEKVVLTAAGICKNDIILNYICCCFIILTKLWTSRLHYNSILHLSSFIQISFSCFVFRIEKTPLNHSSWCLFLAGGFGRFWRKRCACGV